MNSYAVLVVYQRHSATRRGPGRPLQPLDLQNGTIFSVGRCQTLLPIEAKVGRILVRSFDSISSKQDG